MDEMTLVEKYNNELYHHGVVGMKWGIRRYQNKDGSLTNAGKKRYGTKANFERVQAAKKAAAKHNSKAAKARRKADERTAAEIAKYRKKMGIKDEKPEETKPKKKTLAEMSDEEIAAAINRKRLEDSYNQLHPEKISKGQKFMESLKEDILIPTAKQVGKDFAIKTAKDWLGLNDKEDALNIMKKEVERAKLEYEKADYKAKAKKAKDDSDDDYATLKKEYDRKKLEKDIRDLDKPDDYAALKKEYDRKKLEKDIRDLDKPTDNGLAEEAKTWSSRKTIAEGKKAEIELANKQKEQAAAAKREAEKAAKEVERLAAEAEKKAARESEETRKEVAKVVSDALDEIATHDISDALAQLNFHDWKEKRNN